MKLGLKLFSINTELITAAKRLKKEKVYDYIELYIVPDSFDTNIKAWTSLDIPFIIHAPHSYSGLNLSIREYEDSNRSLIEEVELFRSQLNPLKIIFHPGIMGSINETVRQILLFKKNYTDLFASAIIENKPKIGLKTEVCVGAAPDEMEKLVSETGLGFCLDIGHAMCYASWANIFYENVLDSFLKLSPHMFHLSDGLMGAYMDSHINLGFGNYPMPHIINKIPTNSYVTIETNKDLALDLKDFQKDIDRIRKLLCSI